MILRALIFFILIGTLVFPVCGQPYSSVGGRFEFDVIKGCAPLTVVVTAPECGSTSCNINFGDGSGGQAMVYTHTYTTPGIFNASIVFGASGADNITVEVLPNIQPEFDLIRCAGTANTVFVRITDTNYDEYVIDYGEGAPVVVQAGNANDSYSYLTPGTKSVSVRGRNDDHEDNCTAMTKNITIAPALTDGAFTQLTVVDGTSIQLAMTLEPFTQYRLQIATNNSTSWQTLTDIYDISTFKVDNIQPESNFYCFRIATFDPCSNTITGYSDQICSSMFDAAANDGFNTLEWNTSTTGVIGYSIFKMDATTTFPLLLASPPTTTLDDPDVDCTILYSYHLVTTYANGSTSISLPRDITAISTTPPTAVQNISASVIGNSHVELAWTQDPAYTPTSYEVFKSSFGLTTKIVETTTRSAVDNKFYPETPICYQIRYRDVCGNESGASAEACLILLTGYLNNVNNDNSIQLSWTPYLGWAVGVAGYTIEKYDSNGQLLETFNPGNVTSFLDVTNDPDNQVYHYVVFAIANDGTVAPAASNSIEVIKESNIFYPNAFTPNADDLNDTFQVQGQFIVGFEMKVYNRWGELLFTSNDPSNGWDGSARGNLMPEGTYVFVAKITDQAGRTFERTGSILLLKKN
jgi:gliding motility-associated-like protein